MKDKGISRDVGNPRNKATGSTPSLGQVVRMPKPVPGQATEKRRRLESEVGEPVKKSDKRSKKVLLVWTMILGVLALSTIAAFVAFWMKPFLERRSIQAAGPVQDERRVRIRDEKDFDLGEKGAIELVKRALKIREPDQVGELIRTGRLSDQEVVAFFAGMKERQGEITSYQWFPRLDTTLNNVEGVLVNFSKEGKTSNRIAILVADDAGAWKMDFPSFARLASPSWAELLEGRVESAEVRVYTAKDQYFNGLYQESDGWRCYGIASPDVGELMVGYCKVDSPQHLAMEEVLRDLKRMARVTLEITKRKGSEARQYEITRVIARDWAAGDVDLEEEIKRAAPLPPVE